MDFYRKMTNTLRKLGVGSALIASLLTGCKKDAEVLDLNVKGFEDVHQISYTDLPTPNQFLNDGVFETEDGYFIIRDGSLLYLVDQEGSLRNKGSHSITKRKNGVLEFEHLGDQSFVYERPIRSEYWLSSRGNESRHEMDVRSRRNQWANEVFELREEGDVYVRGWRRK